MSANFFLVFLVTLIRIQSQSFEGRILYKIKFQSKNENKISSEKFDKMLGTTNEYYIKQGKYLSVTNGEYSSIRMYNPENNKIFTKITAADTINCIDASKCSSKIISAKILDSAVRILNYDCKILELKISNGNIYKFYFSEKIKVNPNDFEEHHYDYFHSYLSMAKALPLMTIIDGKQFKMISTAIKIEAKLLPDNLFNLPEGMYVDCK